jgi:hypothetical protein
MKVIWPDASLGCPSPGREYIQGKIPGYRIWLNAGGTEYIYNAGTNGQVIQCPDISLDVENPSLTNPTDPTPQIGVPIK